MYHAALLPDRDDFRTSSSKPGMLGMDPRGVRARGVGFALLALGGALDFAGATFRRLCLVNRQNEDTAKTLVGWLIGWWFHKWRNKKNP